MSKKSTPTAEEFQRALLEETLLSLIRDPSRWESCVVEMRWEGRSRARERPDNRCPGWMCGVLLDAPLPPGRYCGDECKQRTQKARAAFRRDLHQLRTRQVRQCQGCDKLIIPQRVTMTWCSEPCKRREFNLRYYREHSSHAPLYVKDFNTVCRGCGNQLSSSQQRRHARWCSRNCYKRLWQRAKYQREHAAARERQAAAVATA